MIKQNITETAEINIDANPNTLWELFKGAIRNETIKFVTAKKKKKNENETNLKHEIETIEAKLHKLKGIKEIEDTQTNLKDKKQELDEIIDNKINGIMIRAEALNVEYNDKNSKYFSNLEKKNLKENQ